MRSGLVNQTQPCWSVWNLQFNSLLFLTCTSRKGKLGDRSLIIDQSADLPMLAPTKYRGQVSTIMFCLRDFTCELYASGVEFHISGQFAANATRRVTSAHRAGSTSPNNTTRKNIFTLQYQSVSCDGSSIFPVLYGEFEMSVVVVDCLLKQPVSKSGQYTCSIDQSNGHFFLITKGLYILTNKLTIVQL